MTYTRIRPKRGTPAQWTKANTVLGEGELGVETPTEGVGAGKCNLKIGDGSTAWNNLPYAFNIDTFYPVGTIYTSVVNTSPAKLFGGTWEQIKDTFLLSAGPTYTAGSTGGEATHKLIENELPDSTLVRRITNFTKSLAGGNWKSSTTVQGEYYWSSVRDLGAYDSSIGGRGGAEHNNMPPYLAVYMWKRIS